ncbi:MAG TPA: hypothetical protein DCL44_03140 [Elusimicrobia bacterium]|nr:hypothetical protein [Elusimicrobiota bacterium]
MLKQILAVIFYSSFFCVNASAQETLNYDPGLTGSAPYSDPAFQDFVETSYGYLNPENTAKVRGDFRDAPVSPDTPSLKKLKPPPLMPQQAAAAVTAVGEGAQNLPVLPADYYKLTFAGDKGPIASFVKPLGREGVSPREYVFVSILPKETGYAGMVEEITVSADFKFSGEKTLYLKNTKKILVLGWAQTAKLAAIYKNPKVAGVSVEKRSSGIPLKTRVKFTLKVPYQNRPGVFVSQFIKTLSSDKGFVSENVFRLPSRGGASKFTAFDVTGSIPVDMVGELSRSPFVAAVEMKDSSL